MIESRFDRARAVADAVLFEGYALYPYRASSAKNHLRWQFGVLAPREVSRAAASPWWCETQLLVEPGAGARVIGRVRFLRVRRRRVETAGGAPVESLDVNGRLLVSWDEGELAELELTHALDAGAGRFEFRLDADRAVEEVNDPAGRPAARLVWTRAPLVFAVEVAADPIAAERACAKLRVRVENLSDAPAPDGDRDAALASSLAGTHLMLGADHAAFVSSIDPPQWAERAARACKNTGLFPVLAGAPGRGDLVLASPIILYDHPQVAPESPGDLFDATEIDEILTLRTRALTDDEKRQARATDARVAGVIDRADALERASLERLHGALRGVRNDGEVTPRAIAAGARVRLKPGPRRTDAQDLFLAGLIATVREVRRDVEDRPLYAVTIDEDPAAELQAWHGRYRYFYGDEVEPLDGSEA